MATNLRAFGVRVTEHDDGMTVHGGSPLTGAKVGSFGDHRIAMASAILGLFCKGETTITEAGCIATSYPTFEEDLDKVATFNEGGLASFLSGSR
jgi:3-phosphoshikimate 1-carboxyvinyltransferase